MGSGRLGYALGPGTGPGAAGRRCGRHPSEMRGRTSEKFSPRRPPTALRGTGNSERWRPRWPSRSLSHGYCSVFNVFSESMRYHQEIYPCVASRRFSIWGKLVSARHHAEAVSYLFRPFVLSFSRFQILFRWKKVREGQKPFLTGIFFRFFRFFLKKQKKRARLRWVSNQRL